MPTNLTALPAPSSGVVSRAAHQLGEDLGRLHPLVLLYLLAVILPVGFTVGTIALPGLRLLLLFLIVPLTVKVYSGKVDRVYPVDVLFMLHVFWMFVAIGINNPHRVVENATSTGLEFLGGYLLGRVYIRSAADMFALVRALVVLVALSLFLAIPEALDGTARLPAWISRIPGVMTVLQTDIPKRMGLHRAQVFFAHPIHYGLFCSAALALTLVGLRSVMTTAKRVFWASLIGVGIFLSLSSGALLSGLLQLGLVIWSHLFRDNPKRWKILLGLFAVAYVAIDLASNRTPIKVFMSYATFSAHNAYWRSIIFDWGMMNVNNNPVFGLGLRDWVRPHFMTSGSVDNFWLVMAMRYGYPGFALIAAGYAHALYVVGRRPLTQGTAQANLRLGWMIMFIGLSFTLSTVHVWTSIYSAVFFLLGAGMWLANADDAETAPAESARPAGHWSRIPDRPEERTLRWARPHPAEEPPSPQPAAAAETVPSPEDVGPAEERRPGPAYTRFEATRQRK